jgi:large subunit ribosomal protein L25
MLEGIVRESIGKKATKALRRDGYLIANIYAKGLENISAAFKANEYIRAVRKKETIAFPIKVADKEMNVVVQAYESHPVTGELLHVDLMVAQEGVVTHYMVPVNPVGTPIGLKNKGLLNLVKPRLRMKAAYENLPQSINIDVSNLDVGDSIMIRDLETYENAKFTDADRVAVVSVIKAK